MLQCLRKIDRESVSFWSYGLGFFCLLLMLVTNTLQAEESRHPIPILQGATSTDGVQLVVLRHRDQSFSYELQQGNGAAFAPTSRDRKVRAHSAWELDQLIFRGLPQGAEFKFNVFDSQKNLIDQRRLRTFDPSQRSVRIALASCMADEAQFYSAAIWKVMQKQNPDAIFFLGDNVYASIRDPVSPEQLWDRYRQTRQALEFFYFEKLIPVFATWDDHDFGHNNGDRHYPFVSESQRVFRDFFPQEEMLGVLERGPGISQRLSLFGKQFLFMDDRSFRDSPQGESMWGAEQEAWLAAQLYQTTKPSWIINGSQVFGRFGPSESLETDFPGAFERLSALIKKSLSPVTFVSGDIHASEILELPRELLGQSAVEITSSSMHAKHSKTHELPSNPRRRASYHGDNFVVVNFETFSPSNNLYLEAFNRLDQKVFELEIHLSISQ